MTAIERSIFNCPVISYFDIDAYYPAPSEERLFLISLQYDEESEISQVSGAVKTNLKGERYIEILFYNHSEFYPASYRRFVIKRDFMMEEEEESDFIRICKEMPLDIDYAEFVYFQESIREYIPDIPIRVYTSSEIGRFLLRLYFSTHKSGAREILYKSSLDNVADILSEIEFYNIIGHSPETILGIPKKLVQILNQPELIDRIRTEESRNEAMEIYKAFSSYFGKKNLPNYCQWMYLEEIHRSDNEEVKFDKALYRRLKDCNDSYRYNCYMKYMCLKKKLGKYNPYKKMPKEYEIVSVVHELESIADYMSDMDYRNRAIKKNNKAYSYEDEKFIVVTPKTVIEFIDEARQQDNCLMGYIDEVVKGKTNIAFIRKKTNPFNSYVTMEINDGIIIQIRGRFNETPEREVFEFVEKMCIRYVLSYDPYYVITFDGDEFEVLDDREDLRDYLESFHRKYSWPEFPDDGVTGEQLCLWDCFPDCFSDEQIELIRKNEEEMRAMELWLD